MSEAADAGRRDMPLRSTNKIEWLIRVALYLVLIGLIAVVADLIWLKRGEEQTMRASGERLTWVRGLVQPTEKHLLPEYTDAHGRLLADPPENPEKLLDPDVLTFAHYVVPDDEPQLVNWDGLQAALAEATGKQVVRQEFWNSADDVVAVKNGKFHVVALHAADTPYLVNNAGFLPVAVLGTKAGATGNRMDIAVPAASPIKTLGDLRGHKLTCTSPDSMTGYRAAIVVLLREAGLAPDRDYSIVFSHGQKRSVTALVAGEIRAAALSDDKVRSMLKDGSVKPDEYRVIYQSQVIPRLTIGHVYNLKPELVEKVNAALLQFENEGGAAENSEGAPMRFYPSEYKKDFEFVRTIDDFFDPRIRKVLPVKPTRPVETPSA